MVFLQYAHLYIHGPSNAYFLGASAPSTFLPWILNHPSSFSTEQKLTILLEMLSTGATSDLNLPPGEAGGVELVSREQTPPGGVFEDCQPVRAETQPNNSPTNYFTKGGRLQPLRLLKVDLRNLRARYASDWMVLNQQVFASAVYIFFTNILPGITFASDLYVLTGKSWGTIEVVFSTGLCGVAFAL